MKYYLFYTHFLFTKKTLLNVYYIFEKQMGNDSFHERDNLNNAHFRLSL